MVFLQHPFVHLSPSLPMSLFLHSAAPLDTSLTCATLVHSPLAASQLLPLMLETNTLYKSQAHLITTTTPDSSITALCIHSDHGELEHTHSFHHHQHDQYEATKHGLSSEFTVLLWIMEPHFKYMPPHAGLQL